MTDNELLLAISEMMDSKLKSELQPLKNDLQTVKDELEIVKRDVKHLKKEAIKMQAMDDAILDEVERVHTILEDHKDNKSIHTA